MKYYIVRKNADQSSRAEAGKWELEEVAADEIDVDNIAYEGYSLEDLEEYIDDAEKNNDDIEWHTLMLLSKDQHTPGPWEVLETMVVSGNKCIYQQSNKFSNESAANAHLISAAPELLDLVKEFCDAIGHAKFTDKITSLYNLLTKAERLIRKAEGRE